MQLRPATRKDLETVLALYYEFYRELRNRQGWPPRGVEEYRREVEKFLDKDRIFIAFSRGKPVGFIRISEREGAYWLEELYVAPKYRGKGIGRKLVEKAEEYIKERAPTAFIMVLPQDRPAIEFWIHMGYNILNTIELAKDFESTEEEITRPFEFFGYPLQIWKWEKEDYDEREREYLETLEKFYKLGGTRKLYLELATIALKKWIKEKVHQ